MAEVRERVQPAEDDLADPGGMGGRAEGRAAGTHSACWLADNCGCTSRRSITTGTSCSIPKCFKFLWVVDFPMFEWDDEDQRWNAAHHPFTSVHDEDLEKLTTDPAHCRAKSYDLVLNGVELGSGSIRIHRRDVQTKVFAALGFSEDEAKRRFGFLLEALEYGAPPHGGIALGLGPAGDDPGGRAVDSRGDSFPEDRQRHGLDVRSAVARPGTATARTGPAAAQ